MVSNKTLWQIFRFSLISILSSQTQSYISNAVNKFSKSSSLRKISWFRVRILISEHHVTKDGNPSCLNQLALIESQMTSICCSLFLSGLSEPKPTGVPQPSSRDVRGQENLNSILSVVLDFPCSGVPHLPLTWPNSKTLSHLDLSSTPERHTFPVSSFYWNKSIWIVNLYFANIS